MGTPLTRGDKPIWLATADERDIENKHYLRSIRYYKKLYQQWPKWCWTDPAFKEIYDEASRRRENGEDVRVDHIVPVCSDIVSGLHVPWNLEIIGNKANLTKSNKWWPGCPFEQVPMFDVKPIKEWLPLSKNRLHTKFNPLDLLFLPGPRDQLDLI